MSSRQSNVQTEFDLIRGYSYENSTVADIIKLLQGLRFANELEAPNIQQTLSTKQDNALEVLRADLKRVDGGKGALINGVRFSETEASKASVDELKTWLQRELFSSEQFPTEEPDREIAFWQVIKYFNQGFFYRLELCAQRDLGENNLVISSRFKSSYLYERSLELTATPLGIEINSNSLYKGKVCSSDDLPSTDEEYNELRDAELHTVEKKSISYRLPSGVKISDTFLEIKQRGLPPLSNFFDPDPDPYTDLDVDQVKPYQRPQLKRMVETLYQNINTRVYYYDNQEKRIKKGNISAAGLMLINSKSKAELHENFIRMAIAVFESQPSYPRPFGQTRSGRAFLTNLRENPKLRDYLVGRGVTDEAFIAKAQNLKNTLSLSQHNLDHQDEREGSVSTQTTKEDDSSSSVMSARSSPVITSGSEGDETESESEKTINDYSKPHGRL